MGKSKLYRFRNLELIPRRHGSIVPEPPHHPHNHRSSFTDTQQEILNTSENPVQF